MVSASKGMGICYQCVRQVAKPPASHIDNICAPPLVIFDLYILMIAGEQV
jgi:hypothetical protein